MKTDFGAYLRYDDLVATLKALAAESGDLLSVYPIGKSYEGRDLLLAEITNAQTGPAREKPAFWVDGNTHAGEVTGSMAALYLIETLLEGYGRDPQITDLLDNQAFYILPRLSPDGAERYLTTPENLRSTLRPWPEPEPEPGLHARDLDGDGHIVSMRVRDAAGEWRLSEHDGRLLVPREPDHAGGTYYRLYREGLFRDYDGFERRIARPLYGLDMNRQYPYRWREEAQEGGSGPYSLSEPEARAHVEFVLAHENIFSAHTYHTYGGAILRPYSDQPDGKMRPGDLAVYKTLGERGTALTGYPNISVFHDFSYRPEDPITGAFDDWAYDYRGFFAFTIEFWSLARAAGVKPGNLIEFGRNPPEAAQLAMLRFNDEKLGSEGFVPWRPFDHPQLGPVEIGGWKTKFTLQNPPPQYLEAECRKLTLFALAHASAAPRLEAEISTQELAPDVRRLELRVRNTGYLPTNVTEVATDKGLVKPVAATLTLPPGVDLVSGEREVDLGHLAGRAALAANYQRNPALFAGLPSAYANRAEWVLRGRGTVEIEVRGGRGGTVRLEAG
jgi:murein tripeptide amidase MpaA